MNILLNIIKVKILVLVKWSRTPPPKKKEKCWLLSLEWLTYFEHEVGFSSSEHQLHLVASANWAWASYLDI